MMPTRTGALEAFDHCLDIGLSVDDDRWGQPEDMEAFLHRALRAGLLAAEAKVQNDFDAEISVVLSDDETVRELNRKWRRKDKATNVLSFPAHDLAPGDVLPPVLGDIVLAYETVKREADEQAKSVRDHLGHLVIHGFLHLAGYDHDDDRKADLMEAIEVKALQRLGIADPYADASDDRGGRVRVDA